MKQIAKTVCRLFLVTGLLVAPASSQNINEAEILPLDRMPGDVLDKSFFKFVPSVEYGSIIQNNGATSFTTQYQPSGSTWGDNCKEENVHFSRLTHTATTSESWDLRIGKGGQIYSFIGPYDISDLPGGVYYVKARARSEAITKIIVKR